MVYFFALLAIYIMIPIAVFILWTILGLMMQFFPNKKIRLLFERLFNKVFPNDESGGLLKLIEKLYPFLRS